MAETMKSKQSGKLIRDAFEVVRRAYGEVDALINLFASELSGLDLDGVGFETLLKDGEVHDDDGFWTGSYWKYQAKASTGGRKKRLGTIVVAVDFSGWISTLLEQPCIAVAWSPPEDDWDDLLSDPDEDYRHSEHYEFLADGQLCWWIGDGSIDYSKAEFCREGAWFFVVPLTSIAKKSDVTHLVGSIGYLLQLSRKKSHDLQKAFARLPSLPRFAPDNRDRLKVRGSVPNRGRRKEYKAGKLRG